MEEELMAISRKKITDEVPMVTNEITDDCIYTGLFGSLDSARMSQVGQKVTSLCEAKEISIVIIDLGNVLAIDTAVAEYLNQLGRTLVYVGVTPILCGITAELANTMVKAGVNIDSMKIVRNLKEALVVSFRLSGYELIKKQH